MKTMRSKAFLLMVVGRVISSIPAFEKYAETNDDFIIVCEGGTDFFKGQSTLDGKHTITGIKIFFKNILKIETA